MIATNVQQAEVEWYEKHGLHSDRIVRDSTGQRYVIGDSSWNRKHPGRQESVESRMLRAVYRGPQP
jgi:hypothetical protein